MSGNKNMNRASSSGANNAIVDTEAEQLAQRLQDLLLPMANVTRLMRDILPMNAKLDDDSKETVQTLTNHFINRITKKAKERSQREQRKTVGAEDILWAMNKMGLTNYAELLTQYLHRYREQDPLGSLSTRRSNIVRPNFELALAPPTASNPILPINSAPMPGFLYPYLASNVLFYDPATASLVTSRDLEMAEKDDGAGDSSSSTADPYGQFRQ